MIKVPTNEIIANQTTIEGPMTNQSLTKNDKIEDELAAIKNILLGFGIFVAVIIILSFLAITMNNMAKIINSTKTFFRTFCCKKKSSKEIPTKRPKKDKPTLQEITKVAYHEAGHAIVAFYHKDSFEIEEISIKPDQDSLGRVKHPPLRIWSPPTKSQLLAQIAEDFGGRIVDELQYGPNEIDIGAMDDLNHATTIARDMVYRFGMSEKLGVQQVRSVKSSHDVFDKEVDSILKAAHERAKEIINDHMEQLHDLANAIIEYEVLKGSEVKDILEGRPIQRRKKVRVVVYKDDEEPLVANGDSVA